MGLPRRAHVIEDQEGLYHCTSRCVRRAFLYGFDAVTGRDFSHRKAWLVERLQLLSSIFAIEVCAYAVMENHYHVVLRILADIVRLWSDREVAMRWLRLFPKQRDGAGIPLPPEEKEISALADCPERIAVLRRRLSSLSWFMGRLNEFIARAANKEDCVKGRFWEGRFKSRVLLDEAAIVTGMVYVDLNPIRAGRASTPEESDFTSIQERIRAWQREARRKASVSAEVVEDNRSASSDRDVQMLEQVGEIPDMISVRAKASNDAAVSGSWLCPIRWDSERRGILHMTLEEYIDLVDRSGRLMRSDKRGSIDADLAPILDRIGINPEAWLETITGFGSESRLAVGMISSLRRFADQIGRRWLKGVGTARTAFAPSPRLT